MENKKDTFSLTDIAQLIESSKEELALMFGRGLKDVESRLREKIEKVDQRLILTKEELMQKLQATNIRIDELAFNRVKYDDFQVLVQRVDKLENKKGKKGYNK